MEPGKNKVGRPARETPAEGRGPSLRLPLTVDRSLAAAAKKLGVLKNHYVRLAVTYFIENELDPRTTQGITLAKIHGKVGAEILKVREHNTTIGNQLTAILSAMEHDQGLYQKSQQNDLLDYLERIELNILTYLEGIEGRVLGPLLEHTLRNGVESYLARALVDKVLTKLDAQLLSKEQVAEWYESVAKYDAERERRTKSVLEKVAAAAKVKRPAPTQRPVRQVSPTTAANPAPLSPISSRADGSP